jgi:AcrR family transcriptional regulator
MNAVASEAKVNRTTIYRRWPNRRALVAAVAERMSASLRGVALPDTGQLERDLVEAFALRFATGRKAEGRAWARLLEQRHDRDVDAIIRAAVNDRRAEWRNMVVRAIDRGEIPPATDAQRSWTSFERSWMPAPRAMASIWPG